MTPQEAVGFRDYFVMALRNESKTTARVLEAVPDDKASYKPHEKSMSAQELTAHIADVDQWFLQSLIDGAFTQPEQSRGDTPKPSQVAAAYKQNMPGLLDKVGTLPGEQLAKNIQFFTFNLPAILYLDFCIRHCVHHRGQLSTYLRPMGSKVPSIYGGSADEQFDMATATQA